MGVVKEVEGEREKERETEREREIPTLIGCLLHASQLRTKPTTQVSNLQPFREWDDAPTH